MFNIKSFVLVLGISLSSSTFADVNEVNRLARCIKKSGAKFYGAWWCPYCEKQKALFGKSAKRLPYVECSEKGKKKQLRKCRNINGYPNWKFKDGSEARGLQSLEDLAKFTNCPAPRNKRN